MAFGTTLKIYKKSNFDWNHLKFSMQHRNMHIKMENSLLVIFDKIPSTIVQGVFVFGTTSKIHKQDKILRDTPSLKLILLLVHMPIQNLSAANDFRLNKNYCNVIRITIFTVAIYLISLQRGTDCLYKCMYM